MYSTTLCSQNSQQPLLFINFITLVWFSWLSIFTIAILSVVVVVFRSYITQLVLSWFEGYIVISQLTENTPKEIRWIRIIQDQAVEVFRVAIVSECIPKIRIITYIRTTIITSTETMDSGTKSPSNVTRTGILGIVCSIKCVNFWHLFLYL